MFICSGVFGFFLAFPHFSSPIPVPSCSRWSLSDHVNTYVITSANRWFSGETSLQSRQEQIQTRRHQNHTHNFLFSRNVRDSQNSDTWFTTTFFVKTKRFYFNIRLSDLHEGNCTNKRLVERMGQFLHSFYVHVQQLKQVSSLQVIVIKQILKICKQKQENKDKERITEFKSTLYIDHNSCCSVDTWDFFFNAPPTQHIRK